MPGPKGDRSDARQYDFLHTDCCSGRDAVEFGVLHLLQFSARRTLYHQHHLNSFSPGSRQKMFPLIVHVSMWLDCPVASVRGCPSL